MASTHSVLRGVPAARLRIVLLLLLVVLPWSCTLSAGIATEAKLRRLYEEKTSLWHLGFLKACMRLLCKVGYAVLGCVSSESGEFIGAVRVSHREVAMATWGAMRIIVLPFTMVPSV